MKEHLIVLSFLRNSQGLPITTSFMHVQRFAAEASGLLLSNILGLSSDFIAKRLVETKRSLMILSP